MHQKRKYHSLHPLLVILATLLILILIMGLSRLFSKSKTKKSILIANSENVSETNDADLKNPLSAKEYPNPSADLAESGDSKGDSIQASILAAQEKDQAAQEKIAEAEGVSKIELGDIERLSQMYAYDEALELLEKYPEKDSEEAIALKAEIESAQSKCVQKNPAETMHIFFHSLIYDTSKAFDGDHKVDGYNQFMTTCLEFDRILEELYQRDFVLISMHDLAKWETDENGNQVMVPGEIYLPENKKLLILSVDDVNYYEYMEEDGFANRIVLDQDGNATCSMVNDQGMTILGDYDVVPILDKFVDQHPDFSYQGAKGILAFTGYEGVLGYRTDERYKEENPNYEQDIIQATEVAQVLRDTGWEFASHSWGHINLKAVALEDFQKDADLWEKNVVPIIGETDIMIYPFGFDIVDGMADYTHDNPRFTYLKQKGFDYFCTVDGSKHYTTHINTDHVRQGRRNLDGYRLYHNPELVDDLIVAEDVLDEARPLPVPPL
ncbi:MAG: polysaccharide deacetylase [Bacillota bacterium]|jgi:hypothetical protein|nr:polysaccharide deacetylase [Bacillota bacterium]